MAAKWTFMVYMAGNNSLGSAATMDLEEMQEVGSTEAVQVVAFVKQHGRAPRYVTIGKGEMMEEEELPQDTDSGSPQTIIDFTRWAIEKAPAQRNAHVLWNHGGGWSPEDIRGIYAQLQRGTDQFYDADQLAQSRLARSVFSTTVRTLLGLNPRERVLCSEDASGPSLDAIEMGRVLAAVQADIKRPLDLFGMDSCLMSTLEIAVQLRRATQVVVGSEQIEPEAGWSYRRILSALNDNPDMDGPALAKTIVATYVESFARATDVWPLAQSALRTAALDGFMDKLDDLADALRAQLAVSSMDIVAAHAQAIGLAPEMTDLRSFCEAIMRTSADERVNATTREVLKALVPGNCVLAEGHLPDDQPYGGISLYMPDPIRGFISPYYADLDFAHTRHWAAFLADYVRSVRGIQPSSFAAAPPV